MKAPNDEHDVSSDRSVQHSLKDPDVSFYNKKYLNPIAF